VLVGLCPPGGIYCPEWIPRSLSKGMEVFRKPDLPNRTNATVPMVEVRCGTVVDIETATQNLSRLPRLLAIAAFNPEVWCSVLVHPGAFDAIGPFRDVASPLREWLMQAALKIHKIDIQSGGDPERLLEARSEVIPSPPAVGLLGEPFALTDSTLPPLVPQSDQPVWLAKSLQAFEELQFGCPFVNGADWTALAAGVWQMNGFLDRSHELAQSVEGRGKNRAGDYWHAIMHRREPDYGNAKYWCRQVEQHGIHSLLAADADLILEKCGTPAADRWRTGLVGKGHTKWNAASFVDLCEHVADGHDSVLQLAVEKIQLIEMALLLTSTYYDATH
jgi:hypothetical protein